MSQLNNQDAGTEAEPTTENQELSWIQACEKAKAHYFYVKNAIDHREEPLAALKELSAFIERVVEDPDIFGDNKEFKNFFYQDCALGLLKRLNKERSADSEYLETIAVILRQFTRLFAKDICNSDLAEAMKFVFDYNCTLHNFHYEDEESELRIMEQKRQEQWRRDLVVGSKVDAIKGDDKCKCWAVAVVSAVKDDIIELEFENDSRVYDKAINKYSSDLAPLGEFSKAQEWKHGLKKGDEVDGFDKAKVWYASTVLDLRDQTDAEGRTWTMVLVGFRLYSPDGPKTDEEGKKFDGWSARFDEWISLWSPKIAKVYTHSKPKGGKQTRQYEETVVDDSNDPPIKEGDQIIYAVIRPRKSKSYVLIQCLNLFGEQGGYDAILARIADKLNPVDFQTLSHYMDCVGKVYPMYHRDFAAKFIPDIKDAVQSAILNAPEASIRNVRKEKIEGIVSRLNDLLKRVYTYEQRELEIEHLNLDIVLTCLKSNILERRIQGIKSLAETLKNLKYSKTNEQAFATYMLEWLEKHKIIEMIFDPKNYHVQIIQRSKEILKILIVEDKLSKEQLDLFWRATEFDDETRREIYNIIEETSTPMQSHHVMQFLNKFLESSDAIITPEAISCISEMGKYSRGSPEQSKSIADLLWRFSTGQTKYLEISSIAITKFCELMKKFKYSEAKPYFINCLDNLRIGVASINTIRILRSLFREVEYVLTHFDTRRQADSDDEKRTKEAQDEIEQKTTEDDNIICTSACIRHYIDNEGLVDVLLDNLVKYSKITQSRLGEVKEKQKAHEFVFEGGYDHKTNITERLEFIKFLASHSSYTISRKEVDVIWSLLIDESQIDFDEEAVFKWLRESCETVASAQLWQLDDIKQIFNERLGKGNNEMGSLTLNGFYCIQNYFLLCNETSGEKLTRIKSSQSTQAKSGATSFSNATGSQFSSFTFNRRKKPEETVEEVRFCVFVRPSELEGISNIWKIVIQSQNAEVRQKATKFLVELYHSSASSDEQASGNTRECLETALSYLKAIQADPDKSEATKCSQIANILKVYDEYLAQSELKGTAGLTQQRSLLKGDLLNKISVANSVSYNKTIGKRIELSLYSNRTVYDIKRIIGAVNKVPAEYVRLIRFSTASEIKDVDNGKTLADLGFKPNESLIANKQSLGNIPKAPLLNPDKSLTKEAVSIFGEWFDAFSHDGLMTPEDCVEFIRSCTDDKCKTSDGRVKNLFQGHDHDGDGKVQRDEFIEFYRQACIRKEEVVRANILAHGYRNDLVKLSSVSVENSDKTVLPRYILSHEQDYFDALFGLLDGPDELANEAWELIQKLATNPAMQSSILNLNIQKGEDGKYNWDSLVDTKSTFKLLYMFQIIESLIEEGGENEAEVCRVYKNKDTDSNGGARAAGPIAKKAGEDENENSAENDCKEELESLNRPAEHLVSDLLASNDKGDESQAVHESTIKELKKVWIYRFLERGGFEFAYDLFLKIKLNSSELSGFINKFLGFLLGIQIIFITSAFYATKHEDAENSGTCESEPKTDQVPGSDDGNLIDSANLNNDDEIFSTPTGKKPRGRQQMIDSQTDVTEDFLFGSNLDYFEYDKISTNIEEISLVKKESTFTTKQKMRSDQSLKIKQLASLITEEFAENLLKTIDFEEMQAFVLQLTASLLDKDQMDFDERKIIENSLKLWLGCALHRPQTLKAGLAFKSDKYADLGSLISRGILYPSSVKVREEFLYTLYVFATKVKSSEQVDTFSYVLKAMLLRLPQDNDQEASCTAHYFELVSKLIEEYFRRVKEPGSADSVIDTQKFFASIIDRIKAHQSREVRNSPIKDETLIGYLKMAHMIVDRSGSGDVVNISIEKDLINELFQKCLFSNNLLFDTGDVTEGTDQTQALLLGSKCKTEESRKWAYKLLWTLCNDNPKLLNEVIVKQMLPLCSCIKLYPAWNYIPSGDSRSCKYSGIRNLGCICYMNSMLQQLYHVPAFRYQLLQADDGAAPDWKEYKGRTIDDNILHQLQRLFGHLELSERVDYNPIEFCFSFKETDGSPTNTSVQHDTEEFFNIIFDRIENLIKPTPQKYLLSSVFGGKNCSQMVCKECGFIRNRFEDFYNMSLTVKERKSVEQSLRKNLEGEVISDYECPGCKKKVDITKRTLISKTPNAFVVQLQRIVFDFDRFENQKVNTYFEFPDTLDLTEYSLNHVMKSEGKLTAEDLCAQAADAPAKVKGDEGESDEEQDEYEGLTEEERSERIEEKRVFREHVRSNETECYEYKLVGVIIHVGTADAGHYYSLINTDRFQKSNEHEEEWLCTSKDKWMEFNDSHVRDYNFEDLKGDAFGGSSGNDDLFGGYFKSNSYGKSAYLLVYEKRFKTPIKVLVPPQAEGAQPSQPQSEGLECDDTANSRCSTVGVPENLVTYTDPATAERYYLKPIHEANRLFVPKYIYKEIWEDNLEFSFEKLIYSKEFYEFVKELMLSALRLRENEDDLRKCGRLSEDGCDSVATIISNMTTVGNKLAFEVLAKAFYNYKMAEVADILIRLYEASDEAVLSTMRHILENEDSDQLLYVFQILLACPDKISRFNTARIVSTLVNRCFEIEKGYMHETETIKVRLVGEELIETGATSAGDRGEPKWGEITRPKSMALRFWDLAIIALKCKAPSCWSKFDHFLTMIRDIINGGETQLEVIMSRNGLIELVDFILGANSPLCKPGERRTKMGSVYGSPNFVPLLEAISTLVLRCYTPSFTKEIAHCSAAKNCETKYYYDLSEDEIQKFFNKEFIKIAIVNSSEALGECFAHLSYRNLCVSKEIGEVMLKIINTSDFEKIKLCMTVTKPYLYIDDEYKVNRAEWILGFSCLSTVSGPQHVLPRFGTASINQITDEPYTYLSPIDLKRNNEALLALLWRYRGKMDIYVVNCLNILLEIIVGNKFLSEYMFNSDPPTYEFARFTDWFRPYLEKELEKARRSMAYRQSPKKEECIVKCFSFMDLYDANLREYERSRQGLPATEATGACSSSCKPDRKCSTERTQETSAAHPSDHQNADASEDVVMQVDTQADLAQADMPISCYPKRYIIGCTVKLEEISREERDGIIVTTHKVYTEYAESQPTLSGNKTLPGYAFHNSRIDADNFDLRFYRQSNAREAEFYAEDANELGAAVDRSAVDAADDRGAIGGQASATSQTEETDDREPENTQDSAATEVEEQCTGSEWNCPKHVGDVVILVTVNNTTNQTYSLKMAFCCDDELSRENIKAPVNDIETLVKPYFNDMWMCVHKVFPEKDWGQFHIEWSFEQKQKEAMPKNMVFGYSGREAGDDMDDYTHLVYGPNVQMNYYSFM